MSEKTWVQTGNFAALTGEQTKLLGALIGLARVCSTNDETESTRRVIAKGLLSLHRDSGMQGQAEALAEEVRKDKYSIVPNCALCASPCGRTSDFDIKELRLYPEKIVYLKEILADRLIELSPTAGKLLVPGIDSGDFFREIEYGLFVIGEDFTEGGVYEAIERVEKARENAEKKLSEFYSKF